MGMGIRGGGAARQLQALLEAGAVGSMGDGELLGRFLRRDESAEPAFAALVDRHGRMVHRICLDVLGDAHEAQDAAQATFFILARKAAAIRKPDALPSWLHGTARRVAGRALRDAIRRRRHERRSAEAKPAPEGLARGWPELHEELARLPDRYREPIVLCDLAGLTHEQAAGKLGCPPRTLETRLYRGRERLKGRLIRRGIAPSVAMVGVAWASDTRAAMPPEWVASTAGAAVRLAGKAGWAAAGDVPTNAVRWARNYLKETAMFKLKWVLGSGLLLGLAWQQVRSQTPSPKEPVKTATEPKARQVSQVVPDPTLPKTYIHPITVTGQALDPAGKPIAGARVYMASRWADYKRVAETSTDAEGRYGFRAVPLPIERADTVNGRDQGAFQVFGEADGHGFAYRPVKTFYPLPKPSNITYELDSVDPPARYEAIDKIVLDLRFPPAARLTGTVADDRGKPLPDVRLEIRDCETLKYLDPNFIGGRTFDTLNERDSAPSSMKLRTTDALGRFDFQGMPIDCRFRISVKSEGFPWRMFHAATTRDSQPDHDGAPVLTGDMEITLRIPHEIPVKMIYADTKLPAARVAVQAVEGHVNILETTDDQGRVTLRLPKGKYRMENWPAVGTPYLVTEDKLEVGEKPPTEPLVYTLRPAANLEVIVTDEATGLGLPGVDLWHPTEYGPRNLYFVKSWEVATRIARADSPRTDERGKLKVLAEPGRQLIGVGLEAYPKGYEVVEADGKEVECRVGETTTVKFTMRKRR